MDNQETNGIQNPAENQQEQSAMDDNQLGDGGKKALGAERQARKQAEKELAAAQARISEFEDAGRSELEKAQRRIEAAEAAAQTYQEQLASKERQILISEIAAEAGLPPAFQGRIQGETREELLADAQELSKFLAPSGPRRPAPVPEAGRGVDGGQVSSGDQFAQFFSDSFN